MWKAKQKSTQHKIVIYVCMLICRSVRGWGIGRVISKHIYGIYIFLVAFLFWCSTVMCKGKLN